MVHVEKTCACSKAQPQGVCFCVLWPQVLDVEPRGLSIKQQDGTIAEIQVSSMLLSALPPSFSLYLSCTIVAVDGPRAAVASRGSVRHPRRAQLMVLPRPCASLSLLGAPRSTTPAQPPHGGAASQRPPRAHLCKLGEGLAVHVVHPGRTGLWAHRLSGHLLHLRARGQASWTTAPLSAQ